MISISTVIANGSAALTLLQTAHSISESGMYALIDFQKKLPKCVQKISLFIIKEFQGLQNFFSSLDYLIFVPRILFPITKLTMKTPRSFLYTNSIGNLALLCIQILWTKVESQKKSIEHCLITRIVTIAFNAMISVYFNIYPSLILTNSLISISASIYSFYKNRQFEWIMIDRTIEPPIDQISQAIQTHIQIITSLFEGLQIPSPTQPNYTREPFTPLIHFDFNSFRMFSLTNSFQERLAHELSSVENELKKEVNCNTSPGTPVKFYINRRLKELVESIHEFNSGEITEKRRNILFRWFDHFLNPIAAQTAKDLTNRTVVLTMARIQKIEFWTKVFVKKNEDHDTICAICQESNPNLQICKNEHSYHEHCFRDYLMTGFDEFLPGSKNRYIVHYTDHYEINYGFKRFLRTSYKYSIKISPENIKSCPTCRGDFLSNTFGVRNITDIKYGVLENNDLVIEDPSPIPAI
jgi:hypothetical protein